MNRRNCAVSTLLLTIGLWTAGAKGQAGPAAAAPAGAAPAGAAPAAPAKPTAIPAVPAPVNVPQEVYGDPDKNKAFIVDFAKKNITNLLNDTDSTVQAKAREILTVATVTAGAPASPTFLFQYGKALNDELLPKLMNATLRQRLNIAIVVAKVTPVLQNRTLEPTTIRLIGDPAEPVMLWGLKAAQPQVPIVIGMKNPAAAANALPPLVAAIAPAVLKHPSGPVFFEAYEALNVPEEGKAKCAPDRGVFLELVKLWGFRMAQYQGSAVPEDPDVDARPVYILSKAEMWKTLFNNKKDQNRVMQMVSDQIAVAAQWADKAKGDKHDHLVQLVVQCAGAIVVIGTNTQNAELVSTASPLSGMKVESANEPLWPKAQQVITAIQKAYPDVQPPPTVGNVEGAGAGPVVGPATGTGNTTGGVAQP